MTVYSALSAVSVALYTTLNVNAVTSLAPGGVHDALPQNLTYPMVLFEVHEQWEPGLGVKPGTGRVLNCDVRLHIFSQYEGLKEAQAIAAACIHLLADPPAVTGFRSWAAFHDETLPLGEQLVAGVLVRELVVNARLIVEEA